VVMVCTAAAMGGIDFDVSGVDVVGFGLSARDVDVGIDTELDSVLVGIKAELDEAETCTGSPNSRFERALTTYKNYRWR
jgi:hypothetical protein